MPFFNIFFYIFKQQIPGGAKGLAALVVIGPCVALILVRYLGLVSCFLYAIPVAVVGAIIYAERQLANHEE